MINRSESLCVCSPVPKAIGSNRSRGMEVQRTFGAPIESTAGPSPPPQTLAATPVASAASPTQVSWDEDAETGKPFLASSLPR